MKLPCSNPIQAPCGRHWMSCWGCNKEAVALPVKPNKAAVWLPSFGKGDLLSLYGSLGLRSVHTDRQTQTYSTIL